MGQQQKKISLLFWIYTTIFLLYLVIPNTYGFEGRPWIDENGNVTDLINLNPDPDGEPWIAGGMKPPTDEQLKFMENVPEVTFTRNQMRRTLPAEVLLIENEEFIPIFNQVGGTCAQASGVAYTYSYQLNVLKGIAGTAKNARAYGFTHNFLNKGYNTEGSWYYDGWEILSKVGAPSVTTFHGSPNGGLSGTRYMNGAERWHTANNNRALSYKKIKINSVTDIQKIKSWMYDLNGKDPHKKGGCVVFAANGASAAGKSTVSTGPYAGEKLCNTLSANSMNHAMTFAGYSDSVAGGALLLVNSWGKGWGTSGHVWVPYSIVANGGLYKNEVWCVTVGEVEPVFEIRANVTHNQRNSLLLQTGFANGTASHPTVIKEYGKAFNFSGGGHPMEGNTGSSSIEVSLDVSEFFDELTGNDATFFLKVYNKGGSCTIKNLTLIDYSGNKPEEYTAAQTNVSIAVNDTIFIPISYTAKVPRYFISSTVHGNGTISPNGATKVDSASDQSYTMTPDTWHQIDSVIVDGKNVGTKSVYTFSNVTSEHTIDVYFGLDPNTPDLYTIKSNNKSHGNISPSDSLVLAEGVDTTITITPVDWYFVDSVLVDGKNLGPLISAHFSYLTANHNIVPFYSTKKYGFMYPDWNSSTSYNKGKIVNYKGHLWKSKWTNKNKKPGGSTGDWEDLGKAKNPEDDTLTIAWLDYISNKQQIDTLIITTKKIFKGDTITVIDTITDPPTENITFKMTMSKQGYILQNGKQFFAPGKGLYAVTLFDLRGRMIRNIKVNADARGVYHIPIKQSSISKGTYLMRLMGNNTNVTQRFIF